MLSIKLNLPFVKGGLNQRRVVLLASERSERSLAAPFSVPKWYPSGIQVEPKLYCLVPKLSQRQCLSGTQVISKWYIGGTLKVPCGTKDETKWNGANDCQSGSNMDTIRNSGSQQD